MNECGWTLGYCTDHSYRWETQNMFLQYLLYSHIATVGLYSYSSCRIKGTPIAWMTWHLQYIFGYSSWCLPFWLHSFLYIPPLYLPKNCLQFGHLWVTEFKASMQQGTQAHGHNLRNTNIRHYERNWDWRQYSFQVVLSFEHICYLPNNAKYSC